MNKIVKGKLMLVGGAIGLAVFLGGLLYIMQAVPLENNGRFENWILKSPAWQFWGVAVLIFIPLLVILYTIANQKRWSKLATSQSVQNAQRVASSLWQVEKKIEDDYDGSVAVRFLHMSFGRWKFILPVRPGHPDIEQFRQLRTGDTVEFEALAEGMECALEHELCGYLRIKSVANLD